MDIQELTDRVAEHLAGRPVKIVWDRQGPAASGVGEVTKSLTGELIVYIAPLNDLKSRWKVFLHEISHLANGDHQFVARGSANRPAGSSKRSPEARAAWRKDPRELAAEKQAEIWKAYAEKWAYKYYLTGMTQMEAKLMCLLKWPEMNTKREGE